MKEEYEWNEIVNIACAAYKFFLNCQRNILVFGRDISVHSTLPIMKKNMWRFPFIIGSFSLRVTSL